MRTRLLAPLGWITLSFMLGGAAAGGRSRAASPDAETASATPNLQPFTQSPDLFPILPWDRLHGAKARSGEPKQGLESIAECGFTLGGFVTPGDLPLCEKLGIAAILAPLPGQKPWRKMTDQEIEFEVKKMVEAAGASKALLGFYIMDEPGAPAFPALGKAVAAVKKFAPGKLAYINLFPSYATVGAPDQSQLGTASFTEYLERFVTEVRPQFLSYDNYMVQYSDDMQDQARAAMYYADLLEVRRIAQKYRLPFWNIVSCNQIRPMTTIPSPANLAFQAYTTLAAGGRGVSWYKYYQDGYAYAPVNKQDKKTETWQYLRVVNTQLRMLGPITNRLQSTGVFFTSPPPVKSLPLLPGRVIRQVQSQASPRGIIKSAPPLMVGEFTDEQGADYVMIVNLSLEQSANIRLETVKASPTLQVFSAVDGELAPLDEKNGQWLTPGQGVAGQAGVSLPGRKRVLKFERAGQTAAACSSLRQSSRAYRKIAWQAAGLVW